MRRLIGKAREMEFRARLRARHLPVQVGPWFRASRGIAEYRVLSEKELRATRHSDTAFIFGSGASLNDLTADEIAHIEQHQTLGFNWFVKQRLVRCDYHLVRGIPDTDTDRSIWLPQVEQYAREIAENPHYADTIFLVQAGLRATNANRLIGGRMLPPGSQVFQWRTITATTDPSHSLAHGLVHSYSTLNECVNFAYLLGWRSIVLVGVDLYDRRYFWLGPSETRTVDIRRDATYADPHARSGSGMIEDLARWAHIFAASGITLSVWNPRSLLAGPLPVYERPAEPEKGNGHRGYHQLP